MCAVVCWLSYSQTLTVFTYFAWHHLLKVVNDIPAANDMSRFSEKPLRLSDKFSRLCVFAFHICAIQFCVYKLQLSRDIVYLHLCLFIFVVYAYFRCSLCVVMLSVHWIAVFTCIERCLLHPVSCYAFYAVCSDAVTQMLVIFHASTSMTVQ